MAATAQASNQPLGSLGSTMAVSDTNINSNIDTEAEFFAVANYTNVGLVENFGEFGKLFDLVTFQAVKDGRTWKLKGGYNSGTMALTVGSDISDGGQLILYNRANETGQNRVACRVTLGAGPFHGTGPRFYFLAMPMSWRTNLGAVNNVIRATINLEVDGDIVYVPEAALAANFAPGEDMSIWNLMGGANTDVVLPFITANTLKMVAGSAAYPADYTVNGVEAVTNNNAHSVLLNAGRVVLEARFSVDIPSFAGVYFGLTDLAASPEMPIENPTLTLISNARDGVGWLIDRGYADNNWRAVGINNDIDESVQLLSLLASSAYHTYRMDININTAGTTAAATFWFDGIQYGVPMTTCCRTNVRLYPVFFITSRASPGATRTLTVDRMYMRQEPIVPIVII